jgi:uncharacterized protein YdbL (DUF1318 family)
MQIMNRRTMTSGIALFLAALLLALAPVAWALPAVLEQAKKNGVIGEQADGYLGFVKGGGPADVKSAMDKVNAKRKKVYQDSAAKKSTDAKTFATVVGKRQMDKEPKGNWIKTGKGWVQK